MYADYLDLRMPLWWTVDNAMAESMCSEYLARYRQSTEEQAPVITKEGVGIDLAVRDNTRVMWDDKEEANRLVAMLGDKVPQRWNNEVLVGGNPRLRLYRYEPGQHHSAHWDTVVELGQGVRSRITLVFYLNGDFQGGATEFPEISLSVKPEKGRALLFQHRVLHTATVVTQGVKYVLRTDLLYRSLNLE